MNYVTAESRTARLPQALPTPAAYLLFVRPPEVSGRGGATAPHGEAGSWAQRRPETSGSDPGGPGPVSPSPP